MMKFIICIPMIMFSTSILFIALILYICMYLYAYFYLCMQHRHPQNVCSYVLQFHYGDTGQVLFLFQCSVCCLAKSVQFLVQTEMYDKQKLHVSSRVVGTQQWHHSNPRSHHTLCPIGHKIFQHDPHYQMNHQLDELYHY